MLCDDLEGWDGGWEGGSRRRGICILIADSQCYTAETAQHCKAMILQLKINFKKIKKYCKKFPLKIIILSSILPSLY